MNTGLDHCRELAKKIENIFSAGFEADGSTVHFINSTFDYPDHKTLQAVVNDTDNCDREGLIDLIVSPDLTVCRDMEGLLGQNTFAEADIQTLILLLPEEIPTTARVPGLKKTVSFSVPHSCLQGFLAQLNLTRKIDPDIRLAIEKNLLEPIDRLTALVKIRHSRLALTATWKKFLPEFIEKFGQLDKDQWFIYLDFILDLSGRFRVGKDIFSFFGAEKQNCLRQVESSRRLTEQLAKSNLETLLLQGCRIGLSGNIPGLLQNLKTIDEICLLIWDRVPVAAAPGAQDPDAVSFLFEKQSPG